MKRSQVAEKYKWDLSSYAKDENDFLQRCETLKTFKTKFACFEGKLDDDQQLLKVLKLTSAYEKEASLLANYAQRKLDENLSNSKANENLNMLLKIDNDISIASAYITPEISKFSNSKLKNLAQNPKFRPYKLFFEEILRQKPHILPKEQEKLLSGMGEFLSGFSSSFDNFSDADLKFEDVTDHSGKKHKYAAADYNKYMHSPDRTLRKEAFRVENATYGKYINFLTNNYLSDVKADCYFAKIRHFDSALERAIFSEQASKKVYDTLIENIHKNLNLLYKFFAQKQKLLKLDKFYIYDQFAPLSKHGSKKYTYDEAIDLIKQALSPLGEKYVSLVQKAKDEKWIDVMPNEGKAGGAYSASSYGANPVVLMSFTGEFNSVSTLAHELGHAIHSYHSQNSQIFEESDYVIFVAEVASTVNETLLRMMQLKQSKSRSEKLAILDDIFMEAKSTIFRQTMFAEFEEWVHDEYEKSHPLSKDKLCEKYLMLNKQYFGPKVVLTNETKFEWARIPHFYRSFYVYKYATGMICAFNIVSRILNGEKGAVEKYIKFLSAGCTKGPIELLRDVGCDLEKQETFDKAFDLLREFLKEFK